jgi:hypothetical protein
VDIPGFQSGGRFIVPPGYNEKVNPFIVAVESGEEVIVRTPQEQRRADTVQQGQGGGSGAASQDTYIINNQSAAAATVTNAWLDMKRRRRVNSFMGV